MGEMVRTGLYRAALSFMRCTEAPSARIGLGVTTPSYACRQPLLDTNAVTATSPPHVYAVLAVGIGVCHPAWMTRYLHTKLAASSQGLRRQ